MKILYLVHQFFPEFQAGTERFVYNTANMTQKSGHSVRVLTYSVANIPEPDYQISNVHILDYFYKGVPVTAFHYKSEPFDLNYSLRDGGGLDFARQWLKNEAPDLIHVGHSMRVYPFILAAMELGIPYIVTATDFFLICPKVILSPNRDTVCGGPQNGVACRQLCPELKPEFIDKRLATGFGILKNASAVVVPSRFSAQMLAKEVEGLKPWVNNHGIRYQQLTPVRRVYQGGERLTFGYLGNLAYHKGVHVLIEAFRSLTDVDARLIVFGAGEAAYEKELRRLAGEDRRIEFRGAYTAGELSSVLEQLDVLVAPSVCYETYSLVVHEALVSEVPVIVSDLGGMTEKIVDGENGFIFAPGNPDSLRQKMQILIEDTSRLNQFKLNIRLKTFIPTVEQEAFFYLQLYRLALEAKRGIISATESGV